MEQSDFDPGLGGGLTRGDESAKIELTYSTLQVINEARLAFDMPALRIIQVQTSPFCYSENCDLPIHCDPEPTHS